MNDKNIIERHPWEPFIPNGTKVLFLGSFPPKVDKWCMDFYYPNKINDFWRIIGYIFYNNPLYFWDNKNNKFNKSQIILFLNNKRIALGDAAAEVIRHKDNASDKFLEIIAPINLIEIINSNIECNTIVSTGQKASEIIANLTNTTIPSIGSYSEAIIGNRNIRIYRMPSTSRAYPLPLIEKASFYESLFQSLGIKND